MPTIRARLNADPIACPPPDKARGWTLAGIYKILANPKYTGYQVLGRRHQASPAKVVTVPPGRWIWSRQPTHPALVDKPTWDAAQTIGAERCNVQDAEQPKTRPGRRYEYRAGCGARSANGGCAASPAPTATTRPPTPTTGAPTTPATAPTPPRSPATRTCRSARTCSWPRPPPSSPSTCSAPTARHAGREGPRRRRRRRAACYPGQEAGQAARPDRDRPASTDHRTGTPADPNDPAAQALRERIRNRYRELHGERATLETQRDQLDIAATDVNDPALLDKLPILGDILTGAHIY